MGKSSVKIIATILFLFPFICFSQISGTSTRTYDGVSRNFQVYRPGDYLTGTHPLWITGKGAGEASTVNATPYTFEAYGRNHASMRFYNDQRGAYSTQYVVTIEEFPTMASVRAALVWAKANLPGVDTTQMAYWGLSVSGGLADEICTETAAGGLANRFACVVNSCGIVNVTVAAAMSGVLTSHIGYIVMGSVNDENGSTAPTVRDHQDYLNTNGFSGSPVPKTYWLTATNPVSFHVGGWYNAQDTTPGYRTMKVDSARWTGHTSAVDVAISMRSIAEQVLTFKRTVGGNISPTANAGTNQTITLPTSTGTLNGTASSDPDGTISTYAWVKTSGPATYTITNAAIANTTATGLVAGTYVFTLTVTDNLGATGSASVTITVNTSNTPPVAVVTGDQTITLPTSSVTIADIGSYDPDGSLAAWSFTKDSGTGGTIVSYASSSTLITGLTAGTYVFRLTVTDNSGGTGYSTTTVTVNASGSITVGTRASVNIKRLIKTN